MQGGASASANSNGSGGVGAGSAAAFVVPGAVRATNWRIKATARPMDIPIATTTATAAAARNRQVERPPLPLEALRKLDRHAWDSHRDVLARWADGSGIGPHLDIVPGSPPRRKHFF